MRWPIRWRLPLLICGLLLASVAAFGFVAYREAERSLLDAAHRRLENVARQLSGMLVVSTQQRLDEARRLAALPTVRTALEAPTAAARESVQHEFDAFLKTSPQTLGVEVWSRAGDQVIAIQQSPQAPPARTAPPAETGFTPLNVSGENLFYEVAVEVPAIAPEGEVATPTPGQTGSSPVETAAGQAPQVRAATPSLGHLVLRRRTSMTTVAEAIRGLLGGGIIVEFGAKEGGVWTDLTRATERPPLPAQPGTVVEYRDAKGARHLGIAVAMQGTPWLIWVAVPRQAALAPALAFLKRTIPFGLAVVALGSLAAWWSARRITRPLDELTAAADAMTEGDWSRRVAIRKRDELGRLGEAFNHMTARVDDSIHRLDVRVQERTHELEQALATLKNTQEELVRREKLAMLGQLASGVGHELRNPLAVMTNAVYFLEMIQRDAPPQVHEYHALLRAQIGLSEKIVSDLLDFARVKPPRRDKLPITRLVDDQLARVTLDEHVKVIRELPENLPLAHVDPIQIGQVLLNLLVNALQAMEEHGGVLTLRGSANHAFVHLDVIDTGPGVRADIQQKIFDALFTTKARGIGLGLSVSRSLVDANGGSLTLSSPPGQGATFTLALPIVSSSASPEASR